MTTECTWAVGVTTVLERIDTVFPRTMHSLCDGGFCVNRLFIDGVKEAQGYEQWGVEVTCRYPNIATHGNWLLGLYELSIRYPHVTHYAMFQDDLICCKNLREYLEQSNKPDLGYFNLYTFPTNQQRAKGKKGWFESNQRGLGAVGLVFSSKAVEVLLTHPHMFNRPKCLRKGKRSTDGGRKRVDGGIVETFTNNGWKEICHNPSLIQHTGVKSSMGNTRHPLASSFPGEDFDAMSLLGGAK